MKKLIGVGVAILVLVVVLLLMGPLYVVSEGRQAVVVRFGQIIKVDTDAGLKFKMPFIDNVVVYSKKVMAWDGEAQRIPDRKSVV